MPSEKNLENELDSDVEKTKTLLNKARESKAEADRVIGLCEASLYRTGNAHIGQEPPESLSYETRLLHMVELCDGAIGNMRTLITKLSEAGKPGLAEYYVTFADNIQKQLEAEQAALINGPHGRFLRETGVTVEDDTSLTP